MKKETQVVCWRLKRFKILNQLVMIATLLICLLQVVTLINDLDPQKRLGKENILSSLHFVSASTPPCPSPSNFQTVIENCRVGYLPNRCADRRNYCSSSSTSIYSVNSQCNSTISELVLSLSQSITGGCVGYLTNSNVMTQIVDSATRESIAERDCNTKFGAWITDACSEPRKCPDDRDVAILLSLRRCLVDEISSLSESDQRDFDVYKCLQQQEGSDGVPSVCRDDSVFARYFLSCDQSFEEVMSILPTISSSNCEATFVGSTRQYCGRSFSQVYSSFCGRDVCLDAVGITCVNLSVAIVISVLALFAFIYVCCFRKPKGKKTRRKTDPYLQAVSSFRNKAEMENARPGNDSNSYSMNSYTNGTPSYQGGSPFSPNGSYSALPMPDHTPMLQPQHHTPQQTESYSPQVVPGPPPGLQESLEERHRRELRQFYKENDPEKEDIEDTIDRLMQKFEFRDYAKALKEKYGKLPSGWDEELSSLHPKEMKKPLQPAAVGGVKPNKVPRFKKYNELANLGINEAAIRKAMESDGVDQTGWVYAPE